MIGIVAVSHSARLAEAALELALQMVPGGGVQVRVAAGAGADADGTPILGTDAVAVAGAIDDLAESCSGVLVLMDLGSAVMSAELALELKMSDVPVRLVPAPFVEGLLAAVVSAAAGATLDQVAEESTAALAAKTSAGGEWGGATSVDAGGAGGVEAPLPGGADEPLPGEAVHTRTVVVRNPLGIHARPAALIAEASAGASVRLRRRPDGPEAPASSLSRLLILGARQGDEIELTATGDGAEQALVRLGALFHDGFGEGVEAAAPAVVDDRRDHAAGTVLRGRGVSAGVAAASVVVLAAALPEPDADVVIATDRRDAEVSAIEWAAVAVADDLRARAEEASDEARDILDASRLLASDPELVAEASALVRAKGRSAARAIWETAAAHERGLAALGGRMAERVVDIRDVRDRIIAEILQVDMPGVPDRTEPFVLVAVDLAPADTAALEGGACVALVTEQGGPTSHTAIIARSLGLPAIVGVDGATRIASGTTVLVDGDAGSVVVAPTPALIEEAMTTSVVLLFDGAGRLADGTALALLANVGGGADAAAAAEHSAEGVGLFRTEFCFLDRQTAPSIAEQVAAYRGVLEAFPGRKVVVRTLDAGSDKPLPFANNDHEDNPALGVRGLRVARRSPALLDDQLRALVEAAASETARVEVMAPMVATVDEARGFADRARTAGLSRVGVMIETPAAALLAAEILDAVDFVSIGTNDLAQYTLAADRLLSELGDLNDPWQPAVLRLIATVGEAGLAAAKPVGVCGEAAGDATLAPVLVGLGVTSLSMTPRALGRVAAALGQVTRAQCIAAAQAVLTATTAQEAREAASAVLASRES